MKKIKATAKKVSAKQPAAAKRVVEKETKAAPRFNTWSLSIYVYWFIIIFFVSATFYILGRSHDILHPAVNNVEITEEKLMQAGEYMDSGKAKLLSGNLQDAIADLTVALNTENPPVEAFILRGEAYMQGGNYDLAMADFTSAVAADPLNSIAFYDRALLQTRLENYSAALADINNALAARAQRPNDILQLRDIYAKRGTLNLWLKNFDGAVADFTNSLAQPEGIVNPTVYEDRAEALTALNRYDEAVNDYMSAIRVISEQIQGAATSDAREDLSRNAMSYFEKSAALNVSLGNLDSAKTDLESAYTIAVALSDSDSVDRLGGLIRELQK